jgi:prepilin-type processing-associated H-X9-DG protein
MALRFYADDYGVYPAGNAVLPDGQRFLWVDFLRPSLSVNPSSKHVNTILNCPGHRGVDESIDYGYNYESYAGLGLGPCEPGTRLYVKESDVLAPSQMIAFGDNFGRVGHYLFDVGTDLRRAMQYNDRTSLAKDGLAHQRDRFARRRHAGRINLMFCDGHSESMRLEKAFFHESPQALSLWNRDHEPHHDAWERAKNW